MKLRLQNENQRLRIIQLSTPTRFSGNGVISSANLDDIRVLLTQYQCKVDGVDFSNDPIDFQLLPFEQLPDGDIEASLRYLHDDNWTLLRYMNKTAIYYKEDSQQ